MDTAPISRRAFAAATFAGLGSAVLASELQIDQAPLLPTVRWGQYDITRILVGHNPIKGMSHQTAELNREMRDYFADPARGVSLLQRCQSLGINACQVGFRPNETYVEDMLRAHYAAGGRLHWIATFYSQPDDRESSRRELARLLTMQPPPIGVQQVGNTSDALFKRGRIDLSLENLKRFRDAGLLVGFGTHNHEVIDYAENRGWDVDFYQCCFYRSLFGLDPAKAGREMYEAEDRNAMTRTMRQVSKPCIGFKVLAAGRHCGSIQDIETALRHAFQHIKPTDVILLGMWQKYRDQVSENVTLARRILNA
jgi:hypothetical protein